MYLCAVTVNIFQAECLQLLTRHGRYVADSEVVVGRVGDGVGGRSRLLVAALLGMTSVEEGSEEPVGRRAKVWFSSFYSTDLGWCFC